MAIAITARLRQVPLPGRLSLTKASMYFRLECRAWGACNKSECIAAYNFMWGTVAQYPAEPFYKRILVYQFPEALGCLLEPIPFRRSYRRVLLGPPFHEPILIRRSRFLVLVHSLICLALSSSSSFCDKMSLTIL